MDPAMLTPGQYENGHPHLFLYGRSVGQHVNVQTVTGSVYRGVLGSIDPSTGDIYLRMAYLVNDKKDANPFNFPTPTPSRDTCIRELHIEWNKIGQVQLPEVDISSQGSSRAHEGSASGVAGADDFTDRAIAGTGAGRQQRTFKRWTRPAADADPDDDLLEPAGADEANGWSTQDMMEAHKKFGIEGEFDESQYTTTVDHKQFSQAELQRADAMARKIQSAEKPRGKKTMADARRQTDDDKYSEVKPMPAPSAKGRVQTKKLKEFSESIKLSSTTDEGAEGTDAAKKPSVVQGTEERAAVASSPSSAWDKNKQRHPSQQQPAQPASPAQQQQQQQPPQPQVPQQQQPQQVPQAAGPASGAPKAPQLNPDAEEYHPSQASFPQPQLPPRQMQQSQKQPQQPQQPYVQPSFATAYFPTPQQMQPQPHVPYSTFAPRPYQPATVSYGPRPPMPQHMHQAQQQQQRPPPPSRWVPGMPASNMQYMQYPQHPGPQSSYPH